MDDKELRKMVERNNRMLSELIELNEENHTRIRKIHANMRRNFWLRVLYWVLIILIAAGAFYVVKPYVDKGVEQYNNISEFLNKASTNETSPITTFIENLFNPETSKNTDIQE